jgi:hypothetical protein
MRRIDGKTLVLASLLLGVVACSGSLEPTGPGGAGGGGGTGADDDDEGDALDDGLGEGDPGEGDPAEGDPGDGDPPDDPTGPAPQNECLLSPDYGALGTLPQQRATLRAQQNAPGAVYRLTAQLDAATNDVLVVELWDGYGPFAGGAVAPGTYTLGAADADYDTCGVCILLAADVTPGTTQAVRTLIATGGTITLTSTSTTLAGSLSGVALTELDPGSGAPLPGATCTSVIDAASFGADLQ